MSHGKIPCLLWPEVLDCPQINDNLQVAVEYQIPLTAKRIDFMLAGMDEYGQEHIILIELKQWSEAGRTSRKALSMHLQGEWFGPLHILPIKFIHI